MIPESFKERMKNMLGDQYPPFIDALEGEDAVRAFRASRIKTNGANPFSKDVKTEKIPYLDNGYILRSDIKIGNTPEHHSGMIYVQDPGAMATLSAIDIQPDWWVADLCAAPGGKSSQIAERLSDRGFLLSNEYVPKRAKIVVSNFERLGVKCAMVTSMDTAELGRLYCGAFDLVVADAPCSGEGMFRKSDEALTEWSEENVKKCASRQTEILNNAAGLIRPGGYLLYSTCTYSEEENEAVVTDFLATHEEFTLEEVRPELVSATSDGIKREIYHEKIERCRRFYPHITKGEGQFLALMKRSGTSNKKQTILYKDSAKPLDKKTKETIERFLGDILTVIPEGRIVKIGENPVLIPHGCPLPPHSVFMPGVLIGDIGGSVIRPSHQLFSAYGRLFKAQLRLDEADPRVEKYLSGEEIEVDTGLSGWCAVLYRGVPLGGGKASGGRLKNHYPKGLRKQKI